MVLAHVPDRHVRDLAAVHLAVIADPRLRNELGPGRKVTKVVNHRRISSFCSRVYVKLYLFETFLLFPIYLCQ